MSGWFVATLVVAIVGALALLVARAARENGKRIFRSVVPGVLALVVVVVALLLISSANVIGTRQVGVPVAFGQPDERPLPNGLHFVAPWKSVEVFDASVQTLKRDKAGAKDDDTDFGDCVTVRLANQTTACVDVSIQWQIVSRSDQVIELYRQYHTFGKVQKNLVERQLVDVLKDVFETYNPLATIGGDGKTGTLDAMAKTAQSTLQSRLGEAIHLQNTVITFVHYDDVTQAKLNAYAQALADTRIAEQRKLTAEAQKAANDALAAGTNSNNPGVLYQNCLDMTERLAKEGKGLPAAWSCGPPPATVVPVK